MTEEYAYDYLSCKSNDSLNIKRKYNYLCNFDYSLMPLEMVELMNFIWMKLEHNLNVDFNGFTKTYFYVISLAWYNLLAKDKMLNWL